MAGSATFNDVSSAAKNMPKVAATAIGIFDQLDSPPEVINWGCSGDVLMSTKFYPF